MNTGICASIGRHPERGLILYVLYRFIVSWLRRCASPLYFSFSVLRIGPSSCIFRMETIDFWVRG